MFVDVCTRREEVVSKTQMRINLLGHLQNDLIVMRTNLIVIVFLKLMGCISSYLMDCPLGEEKPDDMTMKTLHHDFYSRYLDYECANLQL